MLPSFSSLGRGLAGYLWPTEKGQGPVFPPTQREASGATAERVSGGQVRKRPATSQKSRKRVKTVSGLRNRSSNEDVAEEDDKTDDQEEASAVLRQSGAGQLGVSVGLQYDGANDESTDQSYRWGIDKLTLDRVLKTLGQEAVLPPHWRMDFPTFPRRLFTADPERAVFKSLSGNEFRATRALESLVNLGPTIRACEAARVSPFRTMRREIARYLKWAQEDGGYGDKEFLPVLSLSYPTRRQLATLNRDQLSQALQEDMQGKLEELAKAYLRTHWFEDDEFDNESGSDEDEGRGLTSSEALEVALRKAMQWEDEREREKAEKKGPLPENLPPTFYGLIISSGMIFTVSYDPHHLVRAHIAYQRQSPEKRDVRKDPLDFVGNGRPSSPSQPTSFTSLPFSFPSTSASASSPTHHAGAIRDQMRIIAAYGFTKYSQDVSNALGIAAVVCAGRDYLAEVHGTVPSAEWTSGSESVTDSSPGPQMQRSPQPPVMVTITLPSSPTPPHSPAMEVVFEDRLCPSSAANRTAVLDWTRQRDVQQRYKERKAAEAALEFGALSQQGGEVASRNDTGGVDGDGDYDEDEGSDDDDDENTRYAASVLPPIWSSSSSSDEDDKEEDSRMRDAPPMDPHDAAHATQTQVLTAQSQSRAARGVPVDEPSGDDSSEWYWIE